MSVRAKFRVNSITRSEGSKQVVNPETGKSSWEPCEMRTICINLDAANRFELGKEYYLDFTPAS